MTLAEVQDWLDRYVAAWRSNDPGDIGALFTPDVEYRYLPGDDPLRGRDAVVDSWLADPDAPDSWVADYHAWSVTDDRATGTGETRYTDGSRYFNVFLLRFRDGACSEFTEWFVTARA